MEPLAVYLLSQDMMGTAMSALPDAPVIPYEAPQPRLRRSRAATASLLQRLASVIAPPEGVLTG